MNEAILYEKANDVQRRDAKKIINEFSKLIRWRLDGRDTLLDIGCGVGDVTVDFILPIMPKNFTKLVGVDVSESMIKHACLNYKLLPRIYFKRLNIECDLEEQQWMERFDHITSFYCLHWVQNQKKALSNIYKLLNPGGDCLLVFLARCAIFDVYKQLASMNKWIMYMKDVNDFISPLQFSKNPIKDVSKMIYEAGFKEYIIDVRDEVYIYEGVDLLKRNIKAVNPFTQRMSSNLQEDFLTDYVEILGKMGLKTKNKTNDNYCFISPYKLVITFAKKSLF